MSESITPTLFHTGLQRLEGLMIDRFDKLDKRLEVHERDDRAVADRVLLVEERQRNEKELKKEARVKANRRSTLISAMVSVSVMSAFKLIEFLRALHP